MCQKDVSQTYFLSLFISFPFKGIERNATFVAMDAISQRRFNIYKSLLSSRKIEVVIIATKHENET